MPELHHVRLRGAADGHEPVRFLREVRQHARKIEHPQTRIFAWHVEVGEVVDGCDGRQRVERADAPVGGAYHETVEPAAVSAYPERQHEKMPQHRKNGAARPTRRADVAVFARFAEQRKLVALRTQPAHDLPRVHGDAALSTVIRNAGNQKSHADLPTTTRCLQRARGVLRS